MRSTVRFFFLAATFAVSTAAACSSSDQSTFTPDETAPPGAGSESPAPPGSFTTAPAADGGEGGRATSCTKRTCKDLGINCGPAGDGCGGVIPDCGKCTGEETCGGGGTPSVCGKPACTKKTCSDLNANCGPVGDGCGGVIADCGTCTVPGEICGGGGASRCGTGQTQGDAGDDAGSGCVKKTCDELGATCGPVADGCGGLIASCGTCTAPGQTCGGGGTPSVCGGSVCQKKTCASAGASCGPIADGCGGIVQCGACENPNEICGGGGVANVCGGAPSSCTGLCMQQKRCAGGTTSISGTVTTPAGNLPIYGALVYVPNAAVAPFGTGVSCDQCGAAASGSPLVSTTTAADGTFLLPNVPVSDPNKTVDIPVVVQLGRWRKRFTVQTTACTNTVVAADKTALPKNKSEGDIPLTAIATGDIDALECVLRKIGIDDAEFTNPSGDGRIRLYQSLIPGSNNKLLKNGARIDASTPDARTLYGNQDELDKYDMVVFGCVGKQVTKTSIISAQDKQRVQAYANKGGRIYATHYSYVWLYDQVPWSGTAVWGPKQDAWGSVVADVDTSFTKGQAFAQWLNVVGALSTPLPNPQITIEEARHDVDLPMTAPAQRWLSTTSPKSSVQHFTFNTEWGKPASQQCGRVLFSDFHVTTTASTTNVNFPGECSGSTLSAQEKVLAFMLFDLASCVSTPKPPAPTCTQKTCVDQGLECGLGGDGCGGSLDCGACPSGTTCGGGGVASKCGAPSCNKVSCAPNECGQKGDGCGGVLACPACAVGLNCGGGGPNVCGAPTCTKKTCADAPAGACGPIADGCGGIVSCACAGGDACVNGQCGAPPCTKRTCQDAGANCGQVADGCGGVLDCGGCLAPQTCGGGGIANVCGGGVQ